MVFLSHGFTSQGRFDDTWALAADRAAWTDISPASGRPIKRCLHEAAWDPVQGRFIIFGGQTDGRPFLGDLWAFDPQSHAWRDTGVTGPEPRHFTSLVIDPARKSGLLFGGASGKGKLADLWLLDLAAYRWQPLSATGPAPSARDSHDAAFDPSGHQMLVFGGADDNDRNDLWALRFPA